MALRSLKCLFAGLAALAVVGQADTPRAEVTIADDECVEGVGDVVEGACALSALQRRSFELRGEPMQGDEANVAWGQEADESAAPALTAWLESMRPEDLLGDSPEALASPAANDSDSDLGSAADSRWAPPSSQPSNLKVNRRGGLDPPSTATQYNGVAWEDMVIPGTGEMHVFTIGDWGGLLWEQFSAGGTGLHVYPFIRAACGILDMKNCFNETGDSAPDSCKQTCGYVSGVDDHAQVVVAEQMKKRAEKTGVQYILNVGDNFYPQGMNTGCGSPMNQIKEATKVQFEKAFNWVYSGALTGKPWLSVLGNHDYGARQFNYAWDQQVAYTWASDRWVMPALYFSQHVKYPDLGFEVDYFMLDSNVEDAHDVNARPGSNLCHRKFNEQASCSATGGPASAEQCQAWFWGLFSRQAKWMEEKLSSSKADWQIAVTHFPCGHQRDWYAKLRDLGLDLLVTGHIHEQQLQFLQGQLTCIVTGGGGGITSERSPQGDDSREYGFFDLTMSKPNIKVELVNFLGNVVLTQTVQPFKGRPLADVKAQAAQTHQAAGNVQPAPQHQAESNNHHGKSGGNDKSCSSRPACKKLNLQGDCCPTASGAMLGCC